MSDEDDPITDFTRRTVAVEGVEKTVYAAGSGPAVVVLPEMPGISPDVLRLARWVRDAGFTVLVPSLFGRDGAFPTVEGGREVVRRACVSAEFRAFAGGGTWPTRSAAGRGWGRSGCASPATSPSRWPWNRP
ncbi:dienelactone hydrolase family protein [Streptomyces sp. NPDC058157]|uniref:dienelactone hydrolase family protein n=1 Tax=Streptomyces sp. NPDC058157 TaxID=3346360 RepID=UPI0036F00B2F